MSTQPLAVSYIWCGLLVPGVLVYRKHRASRRLAVAPRRHPLSSPTSTPLLPYLKPSHPDDMHPAIPLPPSAPACLSSALGRLPTTLRPYAHCTRHTSNMEHTCVLDNAGLPGKIRQILDLKSRARAGTHECQACSRKYACSTCLGWTHMFRINFDCKIYDHAVRK